VCVYTYIHTYIHNVQVHRHSEAGPAGSLREGGEEVPVAETEEEGIDSANFRLEVVVVVVAGMETRVAGDLKKMAGDLKRVVGMEIEKAVEGGKLLHFSL
jgi:hypothetical protein